MSATLNAAKACASTILFHSLRIQKFNGAIPHVMLVVDTNPCFLQKVLVEGYRHALNEFNGQPVDDLPNLIPLGASSRTPFASFGLTEKHKISYSVVPFEAESFLNDIQRMQSLFRHCGDGDLGVVEKESPEGQTQSIWDRQKFSQEFDLLNKFFSLPSCDALFTGPSRELLGFILIQRNAFQNEMHKYRLRLNLFDMGMRVAEHCHLEIMSESADAFEKNGDLDKAFSNDEIISYARSCSFRPNIAAGVGKAIADAIDLFSWTHDLSNQQELGIPSASDSTYRFPPPSSFKEAVTADELSNFFSEDILQWKDVSCVESAPTLHSVEPILQAPIVSAGEPLQIICRDAKHVLTFHGGMEDCLLNTGYYAAANLPERNDVHHHRQRFPSRDPSSEEKKDKNSNDNNSNDNNNNDDSTCKSENVLGEKMGRMKKKDYLASLRQMGQKPNKRTKTEREDGIDDGMDGDALHARHYDNPSSDGSNNNNNNNNIGSGSCIGSSIGGTFPVGEVISESFDLSQLTGRCQVFAYPDLHKRVTISSPEPFTMFIEKGTVISVSENCPEEFSEVLSLVREVEGGSCYVRELGIGLNPFVGLKHVVNDVTAFERQFGIHLSLGQRHPLFVKQREKRNKDKSVAEGVAIEGPVLKRRAGRYHIDVFVDAAMLKIGDFTVDFTKGVCVA